MAKSPMTSSTTIRQDSITGRYVFFAIIFDLNDRAITGQSRAPTVQ